MTRILMIDDDIEFCAILQDYLVSHGMQVFAESTGHGGLAALERNDYALVLLDVMLPDLDGLEVLKRIRCERLLPVLLLSAEGTENTRIDGLDGGADDYLPKPFNPRELVSRIHAILRRSKRDRSMTEEARESVLAFNATTRQVFYRGNRLPLTDAEFDLLAVFVESPNTVLEREDLVTRVFRKQFNPLDRSLDMHVSRLRRKLAAIEGFAESIRTIRNSGYVFSPGTVRS